jgi:hypothetical protein
VPVGRRPIVLTTPAPVTAGTRYVLVLTRGPEDPGVHGEWRIPANEDGSLYPGHTASERYEGADWEDLPHDLVVRTYVRTAAP